MITFEDCGRKRLGHILVYSLCMDWRKGRKTSSE